MRSPGERLRSLASHSTQKTRTAPVPCQNCTGKHPSRPVLRGRLSAFSVSPGNFPPPQRTLPELIPASSENAQTSERNAQRGRKKVTTGWGEVVTGRRKVATGRGEILDDIVEYPRFMPSVAGAKQLSREGSTSLSYQRISPAIVGDCDYTVRVSYDSSNATNGVFMRYRWISANELIQLRRALAAEAAQLRSA